MHTIIKSLLVVLLVSSSAACIAVEEETSVIEGADGAEVTTIEGVARDGQLHPVQEAFNEEHALQCGYCTPGMIMQVIDLLGDNPDPDEHEVREGIEGNLCRCTGYQNIVRAVQSAAQKMKPGAQVETPAPAGVAGGGD